MDELDPNLFYLAEEQDEWRIGWDQVRNYWDPPGPSTTESIRMRFDSVLMSAWKDPAYNDENIAWTRKVYATIEPYTIGFYSNHMVDSDEPKARRAFRSNYKRLVQLKNKYDPSNLFQLNANIKPG